MPKNDAALRKKIRYCGASDRKTGARLTANPFKASMIRDPISGRAFPRASEVYARCLRLFVNV